ncbi:LysR family transcriptional regulator [Roseospira marina]|uniref:LysR family transcriptional regulator n=1 Tax=Roseospira marina TaxID=140057 RepID=A0A5M6IFB0_9PROT|nr:LysR family transcriptional regulator [Roseospira marina]KAA5606415.1 LysR family transcriptional regulator [Roseospira marina]MBB4314173.1 DNA-binding transcriptional LysR family regulator [Roseospira marina]MBB5087334.1 DNA-binding transcriptional LysR family regulator [Roseospira marina]
MESPGHADPDRFTRALDWNLLRTFMVVVQEGGITSAASRLYLTQPAVSQALKRLEQNLGRQLIERGGGRFQVTKAGERIYREVVEIYGNISRFDLLMQDVSDEISGHVRMLMISRVQTALLDDALQSFHQRHPLVTFRVDVQSAVEVHQGLLQKTGAIGICLMREPMPGLDSEILARQTYRLYCGASHRFFRQGAMTVRDLRQENFVSFVSDQIDGMLSPLAVFRAKEGFAGRVIGASSNLDEVRRMIVCGLGIGPLPEHIAAPDVAAGRLWPLPPEEGVAPVDIHVAWNPSARLLPAEQAFLDHLLGRIRDVPASKRRPR